MDFLTILSGLLTPLIAIIAVYIAYRQYKTEKNALRLELYEKRFRIFDETKKILHKINQEDKIKLEELRDFKFSTNESKFLFERDIPQFLEELKNNTLERNHLTDDLGNIQLYPVGSSERVEKENRMHTLEIWFSEEYENVENRFMQYLSFKNL
jgi:hypothetical protein